MINLCKYDRLSYCDEDKCPKNQRKCRHYKKSTYFDRCMFLAFEHYCNCIDAQNDRNGRLSDEQITEIEQSKLST